MVVCSCKSVSAGEPTEAIRDAVNQGVEILKNAKLDNQKQRAQVIDRLRQIVYPLFDFNEMAMRSLGANWRRINSQQQKEFVSTFTALLEKTYADQIDLDNGQQVVYTGEAWMAITRKSIPESSTRMVKLIPSLTVCIKLMGSGKSTTSSRRISVWSTTTAPNSIA
jgi:ABC-type transporter MlaC component